MSGFVEELEANARGRFVRWDSALWRELLDGPVAKLGQALAASGANPARGEELLRTYLRLGAEAIGLGYLYPASAGRRNFFTLAWSDLLPRMLAEVREDERAGVLAQLWNLGENLESAPPWVQRIFCRVGEGLASLSGIESRLRETAALAMEPPKEKLGNKTQPFLVHMGAEDSRFLPGAMHFLAPTVLCIHDRHRTAVGGREAATQGLWLADTPMPLGAMGCRETPEVTQEMTPSLTWLTWNDPRVDDWYATTVNDWRAAGTLHTSQFVVVLAPA
ncbi:hypothetical protein [Myxococcus sp. RHSTA-1-4]|uniref:hypothetical protein n=1 Tax=Myxococcus sp. RHSTA-1-4 TaxID=2874601 RepID=UPI001CBDFC56|nr:hypothetical protein [Myxococcus sp. RHSTA-1-4]MBZ4419724.1 hypothetical protein [Myxococcus sp. RHSTA-1-4]